MRHSPTTDQLATDIEHFLKRTAVMVVHSASGDVLNIPHHHEIAWPREGGVSRPVHEETTTLLISYLIGRFTPSVMLDAGSAKGHLTRVAASRMGIAPRVFAFDMRADCTAEMSERLAADPFGHHVTPVLACLSDHHVDEQEVWFARSIAFEEKPPPREFREPAILRLIHWLKRHKGRGLRSGRMPVTSIDHFAAERGIHPGLIKIDVEGYEGRVLEGAERTLLEDRPFVILELHRDAKQRFGWSRVGIAQRMHDLGYQAIFLTDHHDRLACRAIAVEPASPYFRRQETDLVLFVPA